MLPPAGRRIVIWLANSLTIAFSLILLWASIELMDRSWFQQSPMLEVPKWTVYMAIAVGAGLEALLMILTWNQAPPPPQPADPTAMIGLMLVLFLVFMVLGMPIAYCMGLAAILSVLVEGQLPVLILAQQFYDSLDNFSLLAVPLFVLAGELMSVAGITERLVNLSRALIGHLRGGLAQANIMTNMFMARDLRLRAGRPDGDRLDDDSGDEARGLQAVLRGRRHGLRRDDGADHSAEHHRGHLRLGHRRVDRRAVPGRRDPGRAGRLVDAVPGLAAGAAGRRPPFAAGHLARAAAAPRRVRCRRSSCRSSSSAASSRAPSRPPKPAPSPRCMRCCSACSGAGTASPRSTRNFAAAAAMTASALITLAGAALFSWVLSRAGVGQTALQLMLSITDNPHLAMLVLIVFFFLLGTFLEPVPALIIVVPIMGR